jgi:hypothetical protein
MMTLENSNTERSILRDNLLLIKYRDIVQNCETIVGAYNDMHYALQDGKNDLFWRKAKELLVAAANVSKALWGGKTNESKEQRQAMREALGVVDDMQINRRTVRNCFEHLDERLDSWAEKSTSGNMIYGNIGPIDSIKFSGISPEEEDLIRFNHYDPKTQILSFQGEEFNVRQAALEAKVIGERADVLVNGMLLPPTALH